MDTPVQIETIINESMEEHRRETENKKSKSGGNNAQVLPRRQIVIILETNYNRPAWSRVPKSKQRNETQTKGAEGAIYTNGYVVFGAIRTVTNSAKRNWLVPRQP